MSGKSILCSTFGSLGDLLPYFAIGNRLQRREYGVAVASSANYCRLIERSGFRLGAARMLGSYRFTARRVACELESPAERPDIQGELLGGSCTV